MRIGFIVTELGPGGAERVLQRLAHGFRDQGEEVSIFSLTEVGAIGAELQSAGFTVEAGGMRFPKPVVPALRALRAHLRRTKPDIVQCWLPHANVIGSVIARREGLRPIIWGIRSGQVAASGTARITRSLNRLGAYTARVYADELIACGTVPAAYHERIGYPKGKMQIIENGIDVDLFRRDLGARYLIRREYGIGPDENLMIHIARWDRIKDQRTLLQAVSKMESTAKLLMVGRGLVRQNSILWQLVQDLGLTDRVVLAGERKDVPQVLSAGDLMVMSSVSEGFPNVVIEAMACELPVVATAAGVTEAIVGKSGTVVPIRNATLLARAIDGFFRLSSEEQFALGVSARQRVVESYSVGRMVDAYLTDYQCLLAGVAPPHSDAEPNES